jgi:hypothetical protein
MATYPSTRSGGRNPSGAKIYRLDKHRFHDHQAQLENMFVIDIVIKVSFTHGRAIMRVCVARLV